MSDHYGKYLKYKTKYLNLKNLLQVSGAHPNKGKKCLGKGKSVNATGKPKTDQIVNAYAGCTNTSMNKESLIEMKAKLDKYSGKNQLEQVKLLKSKNYDITQLRTAGYDLKSLKEAGFGLSAFADLKLTFNVTRKDVIKLCFPEDDAMNLLFKKK